VLPLRLSTIRSDTRIILTFCIDRIRRHETTSMPLYNTGYEQFCVEVVEDLIKKKKITYMSRPVIKSLSRLFRESKEQTQVAFRKFQFKFLLTMRNKQLGNSSISG
jgi:hypothetical protein